MMAKMKSSGFNDDLGFFSEPQAKAEYQEAHEKESKYYK